MNAFLRPAVLSLSVLGLAACASTQQPTAYVEPAQVADPGQAKAVRDDQYMAQVEHLARKRGVSVHWINPPTKRASSN